jgi:hypothetical protein
MTVITSALAGMKGGVTLWITVSALFTASMRSAETGMVASCPEGSGRCAAVGVQGKPGDEAGQMRPRHAHHVCVAARAASTERANPG